MPARSFFSKQFGVGIFLLFYFVYATQAFASATATITIGGIEQQISGKWDQGNITVAFNGFTETIGYAQFSSSASLASSMAGMFSRDYIGSGLCAHAVGAAVTFQLSGTAAFGSLQISDPSSSFQLTSSGWSSQSSPPLPSQSATTITTIAGNGTSGDTGDGELASLSEVNVYAMTADAIGNLYFSDTTDGVVRLIDVASEHINTVAGDGISYGPVTSNATQSAIEFPTGLALYGSETLYVNSSEDDQGATGCYINTVTLNTNTLSYVFSPCYTAFASDSSGNLYYSLVTISSLVPPAGNPVNYLSQVYKLQLGSSTPVLLYQSNRQAINSSAIRSLAYDNQGTLYAGDAVTNVIYSINMASDTVNVIAGNGQSNVETGDGGSATAAAIGHVRSLALSRGVLYFDARFDTPTDPGNAVIRQLTLGSGIITRAVGNGTVSSSGDGGAPLSATLDQPDALAADPQGDLYISQYYSIRKVGFLTSATHPIIASINPAQGVAGTSITIDGQGFGSAQGTSSVTIAGIIAPVVSWSSASLVVTAPQGVVTGAVVVTVNGLSELSGIPIFTVLTQPQITSISPVAAGPNATVTITGASFGPNQGASAIVIQGLLGLQLSNIQWSDTVITGSAPQSPVDYPVDSLLSVVNAAGTSNMVAFTLLPSGPHVVSVLPDPGSPGSQITIYGSNFGQSAGQSTVSISGTAVTPLTWSPTAITITIPSSAVTGDVVITIGGVASNAFLYLITASCTPAQ